jgi:lysylphosphatidylglycerol synthetase-like protein (DUF2156 family)
MKKRLRIRKSLVTKEELIADVIFLAVSSAISFLVVFLFDVHHSFYDWPMTLEFIFRTPHPYILFVPIGAIVGFVIIKLLFLGFREEVK